MRGNSLYLPGVSFVSQDMPASLPHPTDPSDSPATSDPSKFLICPKTNLRRHPVFFATKPAHRSIQPQQRKK